MHPPRLGQGSGPAEQATPVTAAWRADAERRCRRSQPRESCEAQRPGARQFDPAALCLRAAGLLLLLVPLVEGEQAGWPAWCYLCFGGSLVAFALLAWWEVRAAGATAPRPRPHRAPRGRAAATAGPSSPHPRAATCRPPPRRRAGRPATPAASTARAAARRRAPRARGRPPAGAGSCRRSAAGGRARPAPPRRGRRPRPRPESTHPPPLSAPAPATRRVPRTPRPRGAAGRPPTGRRPRAWWARRCADSGAPAPDRLRAHPPPAAARSTPPVAARRPTGSGPYRSRRRSAGCWGAR